MILKATAYSWDATTVWFHDGSLDLGGFRVINRHWRTPDFDFGLFNRETVQHELMLQPQALSLSLWYETKG